MKSFGAAALCLCASLLCGCAAGGSVENLLSPPKLSAEQEQVYSALEDSVGKGVQLQYPRTGAYRSAFIVEDIDSDGENEALAFYRRSAVDGNDGSLRVNFLDSSGGNWRSVYDLAGTGTGIERVIISELGASGRKSVIIGYIGAASDKSFRVYSCAGGVMTDLFSDSYSSMFVTDIDKDGANELSVIHPNNEFTGKQAYYSLITDDGAEIRESSTVRLNDKSGDFVNIASGYVGTETPAVYIDSSAGGELFTEIIYCLNGTLRNPVYLGESEMIKDTARPAGYLSTDIDLDGIIEIPTLTYFPGYNQDSSVKFYVTNWNVMDNFTITKKYTSFYNISEGYCFIIPSRWDGLVTVKSDDSTGDIVFCKYRINLQNSTEELLRISAVTEEYSKERLGKGYTVLKSRDDMCYMYKLPDNSGEPLVLTETELVNNFYLMA